MKRYAEKRARKEQPEQRQEEAKDLRDEQLASETEDLLAEIECCLAEVADVADEKVQAKTEYDALRERYFRGEIMDDTYEYLLQQWGMKYEGKIPMRWCCGLPAPDFGVLE